MVKESREKKRRRNMRKGNVRQEESMKECKIVERGGVRWRGSEKREEDEDRQ